MLVSKRELINSINEVVVDEYYEKTPLEYIIEQFEKIGTNPNSLELFYTELNQLITKLHDHCKKEADSVTYETSVPANNLNDDPGCCIKCTII